MTADIENFSHNTAVAAFMVAVNELSQQNCHSRKVLEEVIVMLAPFAPHIAEELYSQLGHTTTVCDAAWPELNEQYLVETTVKMPVQFNGKVRFTLEFPADAEKDFMERTALDAPEAKKYLEGKTVVKTIVVPGRIINIVVK